MAKSGKIFEVIINKDGKSTEIARIESNKFYNLDNLKVDLNKNSKSSEFDVKSFLQMGLDLEDCYNVTLASKEFKDAVKQRTLVTRKIRCLSGDIIFHIIYNLGYSSDSHVVSCNRFLAMCSGVVALHAIKESYSEVSSNYKTIKDALPVGNGINRLAEKIGIPRDSRLYWLYCVGVENLYPIFPYEVLAIVSWKILNTEKSGLKGTNYELTKSITNQYSRMLVDLEDSRIKKYYMELDNCKHSSASIERAEKMYNKLRSIMKGEASGSKGFLEF